MYKKRSYTGRWITVWSKVSIKAIICAIVLDVLLKNPIVKAKYQFKKSEFIAGWSSLVARWAHNPKVAGSNPAPATKFSCSMSNVYEVSHDKITISFGGQANSPVKVKELRDENQVSLTDQGRALLAHKFPANILFLHQTHSILGTYFNTQAQVANFQNLITEGDYLISSISDLAIGILTADCLPVVFYDPVKKITAVVHAGWRGSVAGILPKTLADFKNLIGSDLSQIQVWFGPAARACCYEVQPEFRDNLFKASVLIDQAILQACFVERKQRIFFDLAQYNYELLLLNDILGHNVNRKFNLCTICNVQFCSYRRDGLESGLQITKVLLKP